MKTSVRVPKRLLVFMVLFLAAAGWCIARLTTASPCLKVTVLDVGQGDCLVLQTPQGHVLVVDAGPLSNEDDAGRRVLLPFLRSQGIQRVDALLLTHSHDDHTGGAVSLMDGIRVDRLLLSAVPMPSATYDRLQQCANEHRIPVSRLERGQRLDFHDGFTAEVLSPDTERPPIDVHRENNGSLVLRVAYGATSFLLTGDAEAEAEQAMLSEGETLSADVLKLGHHGSRTSTTEPFLNAVQPQIAIASEGRRNLFGHPHPEVLRRLEEHGVKVFRTDRDGAVQFISDGRTIKMTPQRKERRYTDEKAKQ